MKSLLLSTSDFLDDAHIDDIAAWLPSGKGLLFYGKSPFLMGKFIINCHFQ
jgi:hypothetical protein